MQNQSLLDKHYKKFAKEFQTLLPDGVYTINLELLHAFELLHFHPKGGKVESDFSLQFSIVESAEKITLINDQFIIWITSDWVFDTQATCALVALNRGDQEDPILEAAFISSGIYNSPNTLLQVLEKFLTETLETESILDHFKETG